jgi:hypothetical protein
MTGFVFAFGYIKALLAAVSAEAEPAPEDCVPESACCWPLRPCGIASAAATRRARKARSDVQRLETRRAFVDRWPCSRSACSWVRRRPPLLRRLRAAPAPTPVQLANQAELRRIMDQLKISGIPPGAVSASIATYDEATANPYPTLPDPLTLKNGQKVTTAAMWKTPPAGAPIEFQREIYGRTPKVVPKVTREVAGQDRRNGQRRCHGDQATSSGTSTTPPTRRSRSTSRRA